MYHSRTTVTLVCSCSILLCAASPQLAAQSPSAGKPLTQTQQKAAMARLGFLVGDWAGSGWIMRGPGGKTAFDGTESVRWKVGGLALLVEGKHREPGGKKVVHDALAVISASSDGYQFRSWLATGRSGDFGGKMVGDAFVWSMSGPGFTIRYTIRLDEKGRWHEVGEMKRGDNWMPFFEMTLTRVGGKPGRVETDPPAKKTPAKTPRKAGKEQPPA